MRETDTDCSTLDLFPEALVLVDAQGIFLFANQSARNQLGTHAVCNGQTALADICAEPRAQLDGYLRACGRTRNFLPGTLTFMVPGGADVGFRVEGALYAPRKGLLPSRLLLRLTPRQNAAAQFIALNQQIDKLSQEVQRRQRAELELIGQREQLEVTLAGIGDAVIATDTRSIVTFLNPVAQSLTGWSREEAVGRPLAEVCRLVDETNRLPIESPVDKVIREGKIVALANHTVLIRKDGTEVPIDDSGAPIHHANGSIMGAVLVFHDISERRRLEQHVAARNLELEGEHRRKDEFLAMLGHELRNPLAPIRSALELQAMPHSSPETRKQALDIMARQVAHLTRLVDELLDVARISTGKIALKNELLDVASVIGRAAEMSEPLMREKKHRLRIELAAEPVHVNGDMQRLTQVISNLLNNAAKYTPRGGLIDLSVLAHPTQVELRVTDNGMGIEPAVLPHIFKVFTQSERSVARSEGGLGIGLSLVHRLVEQHGGSVAAFSDGLDKGTELRILLPKAAAPETGRLEAGPAPPLQGGMRKILVVDDNHDAASMLGELLRLLGHEVAVTFSGLDAIALAASFEPDIIFLDIGLPDLDGYAVARQLRARPDIGATTVLIALTGYGQSEDRARTREAGFDHHLVKPADVNQIMELVESMGA
ncbi:Chemotaxis protein methyltransferase CheR [Polaromonas sp. CG9_12]|nr:Chemotaxis protein methyltransferase CheR [Polaromonas sp. CG9_12]